jgi:hypothetical protein
MHTKFWLQKPSGKRPLSSFMLIWKENIKVVPKQTEEGGVDSTHLPHEGTNDEQL